MEKRKIRWIVVTLSASGLLIFGAIRFYLRNEMVASIIYGILAICFLLIAYAYHKGFLK